MNDTGGLAANLQRNARYACDGIWTRLHPIRPLPSCQKYIRLHCPSGNRTGALYELNSFKLCLKLPRIVMKNTHQFEWKNGIWPMEIGHI